MVKLVLLTAEELMLIKEGKLDALPWDTSGFVMSSYIEATYDKRINQTKKKVGLEGWFSFWAIVNNNRLCGLIGFKGYSPNFPEVEVHYAINPKDQKKGIATAALKELMTWAFGESPNISIFARHVLHENIASIKVLENCGFQVVKTYKAFNTYACFEFSDK